MIARLQSHLREAARRYPSAWAQLEDFRAQRKRLGDWPRWCYCPLAGSYAIVSGGGINHATSQTVPNVSRIGALGAWRYTQGIYHYDTDLLTALLDTPLTGDIPSELLQTLPEWCVYLDLEGATLPSWRTGARELLGCYAHLEADANDGRVELRLLLDWGAYDALTPLPLHLGGTLHEACAQALVEASRHAHHAELDPKAMAGMAREVAPIVSVLLYLCSSTPDIEAEGDASRRPHHPQAQRTKRGERLFAAQRPTLWKTGFRLGELLRTAQRAAQAAEQGDRAAVTPHVRRAHWHTYLVGPGRQRRELRWLSPVLVGMSADQVTPTVRDVEKPSFHGSDVKHGTTHVLD